MTERTAHVKIIRKIYDKSSYSVQETMTKLIKETGDLFSAVLEVFPLTMVLNFQS
uniref:hypothetical protein n=1 Tax=Halanaerobium congolense TaxID=54121 RepID=UPI001CB74769|nr:hypothetical protein [Halanaerobium congolense]